MLQISSHNFGRIGVHLKDISYYVIRQVWKLKDRWVFLGRAVTGVHCIGTSQVCYKMWVEYRTKGSEVVLFKPSQKVGEQGV